MDKILVVLGPTATGKTDLALKLAKKFNGELISADSRQVYKSLDIGTGKMPGKFESLKIEDERWIVDGITIHMYDVVSPKRQYNVVRFVKDTERVIDDIYKRYKLPILVGGTGLYLKALVDGLPNLAIPVDKKLRQELSKLTKDQLQKKLKEISPKSWKKLNFSDSQNPRRLIRAVELVEVRPHKNRFKNFNVLKIGLTASRNILYQRSDARVVSRINQGMVEETRKLHSQGLSFSRMKQLGLEYGILADYLQGDFDGVSLIKILQGKIHSYIRKQLTWFKKEKNIHWFDITEKDTFSKVEKRISEWYH